LRSIFNRYLLRNVDSSINVESVALLKHVAAHSALKIDALGTIPLRSFPGADQHGTNAALIRACKAPGEGSANMDFELPSELVILKKTVRRFVDAEPIPIEMQAMEGPDLKPEIRTRLEATTRETGCARCRPNACDGSPGDSRSPGARLKLCVAHSRAKCSRFIGVRANETEQDAVCGDQ
jgi:hypothetical protein